MVMLATTQMYTGHFDPLDPNWWRNPEMWAHWWLMSWVKRTQEDAGIERVWKAAKSPRLTPLQERLVADDVWYATYKPRTPERERVAILAAKYGLTPVDVERQLAAADDVLEAQTP